MASSAESFVNSIALTIRATENVRRLSGGQILGKKTTTGGAAFPVNTRPTENNVLETPEVGKGSKVSVTA